ncbi:hypothetical protein BJY52DRAFT_1228189, partial [Lactarius psammicola]
MWTIVTEPMVTECNETMDSNQTNLSLFSDEYVEEGARKASQCVDVDAPRAKRRKEAAPQEEKKPEADMDVDVTGDGNVKREQEDPAKLEQVKEQGLKLWQT